MECFQRCARSCLSVCQGQKKEATSPTYTHVSSTHTRSVSEPQVRVTEVPLETTFDFLGKSKKFRVHSLPLAASLDVGSEQPSKPKYKPGLDVHAEDQSTKAGRRTLMKDTLMRPICRQPISVDRPGNDYTVQYRPDRRDLTETLSATDPTLEFCIDYDFLRRVVCVNLQRANRLPARGEKAMRDVFVSMYIVPERDEIFESKVAKRTLNPVFDETFELRGILTPEDAQEKSLVFRIYDNSSVWKNELIGMVSFPLNLLSNLEGICVKRKIDVRAQLLKVMGRSHDY